MEGSETIRILIADDHALMREGLAAVIDRQPDMKVVAEAGSGEAALQAFRLHRPDLALIDVRMPRLDGIGTTVAILREFPGSRVVMLSTFDGDEDIHRALRAGARGYLLKGICREELVEAIRAVHSGQRRIPTAVAERLAERPPGTELTGREREVLAALVRGRTNKEIGAELFITEGTVKWHVNIILAKLGVTDRTQAAVAAVRRGIVHLE
jgi:two-component system NarL family response regulator